MEVCNCNESCFFFEKKMVINKEGLEYVQITNVNKCNRSLAENPKKKPCNYKTTKIISEQLLNDNNDNKVECEQPNIKSLTYEDVRNDIIKSLTFYNVNSTNYFGRLNNNLRILGYDMHNPPTETLDELKYRLSKPPNNKKSILYINKDSYLSQTLGENEYDEDKLKEYFNGIFKNVEMSTKWKNDDNLKSILIINKRTNKLRKNKVNVKQGTKNKSNVLNLLHNIEEDESTTEYNTKNNNYRGEYNEDEYGEDNEEEEDNNDSDEEDKDKDKEDNDQNDFDVEQLSDDDYENCDYEDFSD